MGVAVGVGVGGYTGLNVPPSPLPGGLDGGGGAPTRKLEVPVTALERPSWSLRVPENVYVRAVDGAVTT